MYAGYPPVMYRLIPKNREENIIVSAVLINGRYILFDTYYKNLFFNERGNLAGIEDLGKNPSLASLANNKPLIRGVTYVDYFTNVVPIGKLRTPRAKLQMPLPRLMYEIKLRLGITESTLLWYGNRTE
jgi:hypothetical protein